MTRHFASNYPRLCAATRSTGRCVVRLRSRAKENVYRTRVVCFLRPFPPELSRIAEANNRNRYRSRAANNAKDREIISPGSTNRNAFIEWFNSEKKYYINRRACTH